ncbi:branched chain amino acid aminotransferase [Pilimelia anulata]|uniref:Branched chain amino acid aminotransferase n=1 Tax=Pilimelia anulata TaxID=53371 RepID=A0A8J3F7P2_9ACTN|nr:aminotransferase class IV [Pilimelia anulata]GGJ78775.1 branched chain amino acid aminotransferase [Pilimelia anulata]
MDRMDTYWRNGAVDDRAGDADRGERVAGVVEAMRCYHTLIGPAVFRHADHLAHWRERAAAYGIDLPYGDGELRRATLDLIARAKARSCWVRARAARHPGGVDVTISLWRWGGAELGDDGPGPGVRARVIPLERTGYPAPIDAGAHRRAPADATLLDNHASVRGSAGESLFAVRGGVLATAPADRPAPGGVDRATVLDIARDLGHPVVERPLTRADLAAADEVFMTGAAAPVTPLREIDGRAVGAGAAGPVTRAVHGGLVAAYYGYTRRYHHWLDPVPVTVLSAM